MGKSMYDFGKRAKEKARQQKQMDKASKRIMAKQQEANIKANTPNADSNVAEPKLIVDNVKNTTQGLYTIILIRLYDGYNDPQSGDDCLFLFPGL